MQLFITSTSNTTTTTTTTSLMVVHQQGQQKQQQQQQRRQRQYTTIQRGSYTKCRLLLSFFSKRSLLFQTSRGILHNIIVGVVIFYYMSCIILPTCRISSSSSSSSSSRYRQSHPNVAVAFAWIHTTTNHNNNNVNVRSRNLLSLLSYNTDSSSSKLTRICSTNNNRRQFHYNQKFCQSNNHNWIGTRFNNYYSYTRWVSSSSSSSSLQESIDDSKRDEGKRQQPSKKKKGTVSSFNKDQSNNNYNNTTTTKKKRPSSKKFQIIDNKNNNNQAEKLAAAFDELAKKEGFDSSLSFYANDATFEDAFDMNDDNDNDVLDDDNDDDDYLDFGDENETFDTIRTKKDSTIRTNNIDDDNEFDVSDEALDSMESRIAIAKRDMDQGRVSVPIDLDEYAKELSPADLRKLGYRREINPFANDETPRKEQFTLIKDAMKCTACGSDFQCNNEQKPGYLPPDKYTVQVQLSKIEEIQKIQTKAEESNEWSTDDEIEWLIQTSSGRNKQEPNVDDSKKKAAAAAAVVDIDAIAEDMGLDLLALSQKKVICQRCHSLQNFGKVETILRPGWTKEPLLSQENFRDLLRPLSQKPAVIIALVDLFDFSGSVLPELDNIAGDNPVILAANKVDLLPSQMGQLRVETWVRRELEYIGIQSLANIGGSIRLISCRTGVGVEAMLNKARKLAEEIDCDIYIVGAANSGKSTLMNRILAANNKERDEESTKIRAGNRNKIKDAVTTSPLPGTTLKFISADLGGGRKLYDTPGLLVPGTLTQLLTPEELKVVVPRNRVEPITFRITSGKCVLVGGLARIELTGDSKPFLFTFFVANAVKLHPTDTSKADDFLKKHIGGMLTPPLPPGLDRLEEIGEFEEHDIDIDGNGWKQAAADITLTGLGWVAVTGVGKATVTVRVPKGVGVELRPPLMPFDVWETTAKYTGSRSVRKSSKTMSGKRRKGVGRN